jgi:uncharacterized protein YfaS (alpha-2-macroglobulin family)
MVLNRVPRFALSLSVPLGLFATPSFAADVVSFYPTGSVKQVQQVTVRFSADVIAMGDPRAKTDPFILSCNAATIKESVDGEEGSKTHKELPKTTQYTTRWADNRNWVLDFKKPLESGVRCTFKLNPKSKDLAGASLQGLDKYTFSTSGPALLGVNPRAGTIEPDQYFVTLLDGELNLDSVVKNAYFEVEGIPDKVTIKIIDGSTREATLRAAIKNEWQWDSFEELLKRNPSAPLSKIKEMDNFLILAATRRFPEQAKVVLHWPKGILSKSGLPVEEPQSFHFNVIEAFQAKFNCERSAPDRPCNPILDMRVNFTKAVPLSDLAGAKIQSSDGKIWTPKELSTNEQQRNPDDDKNVTALTFKAPFPESAQFKVILPDNLKDELGRLLTNQKQYPLQVATDESVPLIKFPGPFGIIELKADPVLPLSVRNIEKQIPTQGVRFEAKSISITARQNRSEVIDWYQQVLEKDRKGNQMDTYHVRNESLIPQGKGSSFQIPKPLGEREFELVGIPLKKPGFYVVEVASPRLGKALTNTGPMYVAAAALVTDMAVHFKKGRESSVIWVTQLSDAKPVSGAEVAVVNRAGEELAKGTTDSQGILRLGEVKYPCMFDPDDPEAESYGKDCEVYAFAKKGEDFSFTLSSWDQGIETYRFGLSQEYLSKKWGPVVLNTVLDRMAAQPGDTIQMKHVLREHRQSGFAMMNASRLPKRVLVVHQGSRKTYTLPFEFDKATGTAVGKFNIPKDATLGRYSIYLSNKDKLPKDELENQEPFDWSAKETGHFIVSEYRLPLMKAAVKIQGEPPVRPKDVNVDLSAGYLSGGPAKGLKVKLRVSLEPGSFTPDVPGAADYSFFDDPVKTGTVDSEQRQSAAEAFLKTQDLTLDAAGGLLAKVSGLPAVTKIQKLSVEMEYTDPNGEVKTKESHVQIFPAENVIGLRTDSWYASPGKTKVAGVITSNLGVTQRNKKYIVEAFRRNYITHRKRLVGGFYSYDSKSEITALGRVCEGESDELGRFKCEPEGLAAGSIILQARTADDKGRTTFASVRVSVFSPGAEDAWWVPSDSDRIDLLPEKNRYEPGETAKLVVRSPFPISTVLVTVEREGVLESFVTEVKRDNPVIEVPLKGNYAPNVFISALALRGRVGDPKPTAIQLPGAKDIAQYCTRG